MKSVTIAGYSFRPVNVVQSTYSKQSYNHSPASPIEVWSPFHQFICTQEAHSQVVRFSNGMGQQAGILMII